MTNDDSQSRLETLLDEIETLLKTPQVEMTLGARGVNSSLALLAVQGVRAYLAGNKSQSAEDLKTVAEEIQHRLLA
jgi:hypothetical protein